jgi:flavin-dependent dehydrogenase
MQTCDVIILGGGPAGLAAAITIVKSYHLNVIVIEKSDYSELKIGETIQPECRPLLQRLGVWEAFLNDKHLPSNGTSAAWGSTETGYNDSIFNVNGNGWHLDRARFEQTLAREANKAGVTILTNTTFASYKKLPDYQWLIDCKAQDREASIIKSSFIIDASGRRAVFARMQKARKILHDNLCGVFLLLKLNDNNLNSFTFVEAAPDGWWYSARLPDDKAVLGFLTDGNIVKEKRINRVSELFEHLKTAGQTKKRLNNTEAMSKPIVVPANSYILDKISGSGWLAVGDAACAFDPLSAQGIYKGLHNGITAANIINNYFSGSVKSLDDYEDHINSTFNQYLEMKLMYYRSEKRWAENAFWQSRHKRADVLQTSESEFIEVKVGS